MINWKDMTVHEKVNYLIKHDKIKTLLPMSKCEKEDFCKAIKSIFNKSRKKQSV